MRIRLAECEARSVKASGKCPKCGTSDRLVFPGHAGTLGSGSLMVGMTVFSAIPVTRYVCLGCGFVEEWIDRASQLEKLRALRSRRRRSN